jgi:hypothetical protein
MQKSASDKPSQEKGFSQDTITAGSSSKKGNPPFSITPARKEHDMKDIDLMIIAHIVGE